MDAKAVVKICKDMGCCDSCCLRFVGVKSPSAYQNCHNHIAPYYPTETNGYHSDDSDGSDDDTPAGNNAAVASVLARFPPDPQTVSKVPLPKRQLDSSDHAEPSRKRKKSDNCVTCLGILQKETWEQAADMVKEVVGKKQYDANSFAAALSAPICIIYRERVVCSRLKTNIPEYDPDSITALKEGWKWSFAPYLAKLLDMKLDSGKYAQLLITLNYKYPNDLQDLEVLKTLAPTHFAERAQQRRFTIEFTRRSVIDALDNVEDSVLAVKRLTANTLAACVSVVACHEPVYLAGRYLKLSRYLPQTPWLVQGRRMVASSVQDIIFSPIARLYGMSPEDVEHRLKFMSAGREDVDVRCLGEGRPFAIEISDPRRSLTTDELAQVCQEISQDQQVVVKTLVHVNKEALVQLKKGEQVKSKTYEALVVKLKPINDNAPLQFVPCPVTEKDIESINKFAPVTLLQKTPLRVLHRRPLLTRRRGIYELNAQFVENEPTLIKIRLKTEAGTYVKEFVHGECGRTQPCLADALKPKPIINETENIKETDKNSENVEEKNIEMQSDKKKNIEMQSDEKKSIEMQIDEKKSIEMQSDEKKSMEMQSDEKKDRELQSDDNKDIELQSDEKKNKDSLNIEQSNMESKNNNTEIKLRDMIRFDILALDVESVHLEWPIVS